MYYSLFSGKPLNEVLVIEEFVNSTEHFLFVTFSVVREKMIWDENFPAMISIFLRVHAWSILQGASICLIILRSTVSFKKRYKI